MTNKYKQKGEEMRLLTEDEEEEEKEEETNCIDNI